MNPKKLESKDIVLSLWGVVLAFLVQILYDTFGQESFTKIMPKLWWGTAISVVLAVSLVLYMSKLRINSENNEKQPKEAKKKESIEGLIRIVDKNFEKKTYATKQLAAAVGISILVMLLYIITAFIFLGSLLGIFPMIKELSIAEVALWFSVLAVFLAIIQIPLVFIPSPLLPKMSAEELGNWNYERMKEDVAETQRPLLKALTLMKSEHPDFKLLDMFKDETTKALFDEKTLLQGLYG